MHLLMSRFGKAFRGICALPADFITEDEDGLVEPLPLVETPPRPNGIPVMLHQANSQLL